MHHISYELIFDLLLQKSKNEYPFYCSLGLALPRGIEPLFSP